MAAPLGVDIIGAGNISDQYLTNLTSFPLEVDLYWASAAGADIVPLLDRLGERVTAVHVKDGTLDPIPTIGAAPTDQVSAGSGVVKLTAALDHATSLQYAIVEFDNYEGDIWQGITAGYEFLTARGLV